jgi:O-antigen/teichoic acid export membrane protein
MTETPPQKPPSDTTAAHDKPLLDHIMRETSLFAVLQVLAALLTWAANLLLARILDKRDFGVYGICTFFLGVGSLIGDGGLAAALLRRKEAPTDASLKASAGFALLVATVLASTLAVLAPYVGARYHLTAAESLVVRAMAPLYIIGALRMIPYVRLERAMAFSSIARVELYASLARHTVAIALAFALGGVWALVASNIVSAVLQCVLAFRASPGWPGVSLRWSALKPLLGFGAKVQALGIFSYIKDNISRAMLGQAMGPVAVGVFDFGLAYIQLPVLAVNSLARVQLPVYARLDPEDPTLYKAVRGGLRAAALFGVPALIAMTLGAPWVIPTLYAPKWTPAFPVIWGLLGNMMAGLFAAPLFGLMQGQNRAGTAIGIFSIWTFATWALAIGSVFLYPEDLGKIAWCYSAVTVVVVGMMFVWAARVLKRSVFSAVRGPVIAGGAGLAAALLLRANEAGVLGHPLVVALCSLCIYVVALLLLEGQQVVQELRSVLKKQPLE